MGDEVTRELHRAILEAESYPFETPKELTEAIERRIRQRRWYRETEKALEVMKSGEISNNARA